MELDDETEKMFEDNKGDADSLAGFLLEINGAFPKRGQEIQFGRYVFTVQSLDRKRIKQILLTIADEENQYDDR